MFFTGDELVQPGEPLPPGAIYNSNRYALRTLLEGMGCEVRDLGAVEDRLDATCDALRRAAADNDLVITSGGTGIAKRDVTVETVEALFDKTIPAFGEMMTYFAYRRVCGVQAMAYRATAGIIHQCQVYCLPALPSLIKIGMEKIVLPEVFHLYSEIKK